MTRNSWVSVFQTVILLTLCAFPANALTVRVLVTPPHPVFIVGVSKPSTLYFDRGGRAELMPGTYYKLSPEQSGTLTPSKGGFTLIDNRWYAGQFRLEHQGKNLAPVEWVELETYLRGVVPRGMPSRWSLEALKAQAISARTYAVTSLIQPKWRGQPYDLVSDTRDQVYGGMGQVIQGRSIWLAHPQTDRAIAQTKGIIIGNGKVRGEYRAHGILGWKKRGKYDLPINRKGILSQTVSQQMAQKGWNYRQILWFFYQSPLGILET
ncbi:MAG: SpoIID/LytB domain-containing protein [Gloeobacterales cyanobacterium]